MNRGNRELLIAPALRTLREEGGQVVLTKKFLEGLNAFAAKWPGPLRVSLLETTALTEGNLDEIATPMNTEAFRLEIRGPGESLTKLVRRRAPAVVLATLADENTTESTAPSRSGLPPIVYLAENSVRTRIQFNRLQAISLIRRVKRAAQELPREYKFRAAIRSAAGAQCNGLPTYEAYSKLNSNCLLFLDSRVQADDFASTATLDNRLAEMSRNRGLRLAFSGRLIPAKGALKLIEVARALKRLGVPFSLDIFGDGTDRTSLVAAINRHQLGDRVRWRGVLDYRTELVPHLSANVDLFVCCHPQGDPSCTYLETLACGIPIVGFANEALAGLVKLTKTGACVPIGSADKLAAQIAKYNDDRLRVAEESLTALKFAQQHSFAETIRSRVDHLLSCID